MRGVSLLVVAWRYPGKIPGDSHQVPDFAQELAKRRQAEAEVARRSGRALLALVADSNEESSSGEDSSA